MDIRLPRTTTESFGSYCNTFLNVTYSQDEWNYSIVNSNRLHRYIKPNIKPICKTGYKTRTKSARYHSNTYINWIRSDEDIVDVDLIKWADVMNDVQCGCLTYKYSLIAVILVPIICTLSMSLLVSLASTVPTTINNRFRFSHDVLRRRVFGEFQRDCEIVKRESPW